MRKLHYISISYEKLSQISYNQLYDRVFEIKIAENLQQSLKLIDIIVTFTEKAESFRKEGIFSVTSQNFYFMVRNLQEISEIISAFEHFQQENLEITRQMRNKCLGLVFSAFFLIVFFLFMRIKLYLECYDYINKIFTMLINIAGDDLNTLKNYLIESASYFKKERQNNKNTVNEKTFSNFKISKQFEKTKKNFQRKAKFYQRVPLPIKRLLILNLPLYLIVLAGYLSLLAFSGIFSNQLEESIKLKNIIKNGEIMKYAGSLIDIYDFLGKLKFKTSHFNATESQLLDKFTNVQDYVLLNVSNLGDNRYRNEIESLYQKDDVCSFVFQDNKFKELNDFYQINSMNYNDCYELMSHSLSFG
jgi:hypothetical protein